MIKERRAIRETKVKPENKARKETKAIREIRVKPEMLPDLVSLQLKPLCLNRGQPLPLRCKLQEIILQRYSVLLLAFRKAIRAKKAILASKVKKVKRASKAIRVYKARKAIKESKGLREIPESRAYRECKAHRENKDLRVTLEKLPDLAGLQPKSLHLNRGQPLPLRYKLPEMILQRYSVLLSAFRRARRARKAIPENRV